MSRARRVLGMAALILPGVAGAQTESRLSADAAVTAGYSNNPFTEAGSDNGAGVVSINLAPHYELVTPRSTVTISADANLQQYLRRYGRNDGYSAAVDYRGRSTERLTTHLGIQFSSAVLGSYNGLGALGGLGGVVGASGLATNTATAAAGATAAGAGTATGAATAIPAVTVPTAIPPLTQYSDVGLFGLRNRRTSGRVAGDFALALSGRDALSASAFGEVTRYDNFRTGDYSAFGGTLGYSRRINSRLSVGLAGSGSSYVYRSGVGNSRIFSIQATGSDQFTERWSLDGALGVSFVDSDGGGSTRSTSLSGNLDLCRRGPLSRMCLALARQVSPTGIAGTQYVSSAALSWNRTLDLRSGVSVAATYSKVGGGNQLLAPAIPLETQFLQASAAYNRRLGRRLGLVVSAYYRDLLDDTVRRSDDFGGRAGLSYRFGDPR